MSQPEIPDNNLPVYLQQYEVNILNTDKLRPCDDQSCVSSERGCCPDNVTPVPPSAECEIGGCAGTEFGCCPFSTEAKADPQGSNCGTIAGSVLYTTVGAIPSNEPEARVWQLNLSGSLKPGVEKYYIVYDFQNVNYKYKDRITFENSVTGTFTICGRVLDASKYLDYTYCDETLLLTIIIETKKWDFRLKKETTISYQIQIDDDASSSCSSESACFNNVRQCLPLLNRQIPIEGSARIAYYTSLNTNLDNAYTVYDVAIIIYIETIISYNITYCYNGQNNAYTVSTDGRSLPLTLNIVELEVPGSLFKVDLFYNYEGEYLFTAASAKKSSTS